jgi:hypothetical protein
MKYSAQDFTWIEAAGKRTCLQASLFSIALSRVTLGNFHSTFFSFDQPEIVRNTRLALQTGLLPDSHKGFDVCTKEKRKLAYFRRNHMPEA